MLDKKYLKWVRFDLHHHTIEDKSINRQTSNPDAWKKILDHCEQNKIKLIAITDHNQISWESYNKFNNYIKEKNYELVILPGIEMQFKFLLPENAKSRSNPNNLDINFIFDNQQTEKIKKFWDNYCSKKNLNQSKRLNFENNYYDFCIELQKHDIKYITLLGDQKSSNSRIKLSSEIRKKNIFKFFDFSEGKFKKGDKDFLRDIEDKYDITNNTSRFQTTHSDLVKITLFEFEKQAKNLSWYLGEWSFRGLLKIAINKEKRIRSGEEPSIIDRYIEEINIKNQNQTLTLNPGLNIIIGKRGSGKTVLIESIYKHINQQKKENTKPQIIEKINYKNQIPIEKHQIFRFKQNQISDFIKNIEIEVDDFHKKDLQKTLLSKPLSIFLSENSEIQLLGKLTKDMKENYDAISNNFKELIKNELNKIKEDIKENHYTKISDFKIKLNNQFDTSNYFNHKKNIRNDLKILKQAMNNLFFLWIKKDLQKITDKLNNYQNNISELETYVKLMETIIKYSKTPLPKQTKITSILSTISSTSNKIIQNVKNYNLSKINIISLIKKEHQLFDEYQKKYQIWKEDIKSKQLKDISFTIKMKIKLEFDFISYFENEIAFYFKTIKKKDNHKFNFKWLISLPPRLKAFKNHNYLEFFDIQTNSYIGNKKIEDLSPGQRQDEFFELYFKQQIDNDTHKILLLDQPDDNLDSETITKIIIEKFIYEYCFQKQIIIVTHDAKMALNSDPQTLIFSKYSSSETNNFYENIDLFSLNDEKIYSLLDGRKKFPLQRFKVYRGYYDK